MGARDRLVAGLACAAALTLVACGASDRAPDAADAAERFAGALESGDGAAACHELSAETVATLERDEGKPCDEAILSLELPGGQARHTNAYVTSAAVTLSDGSTTFLDEGPGGWKVSAAGCQHTGRDQPFDCELEN